MGNVLPEPELFKKGSLLLEMGEGEESDLKRRELTKYQCSESLEMSGAIICLEYVFLLFYFRNKC